MVADHQDGRYRRAGTVRAKIESAFDMNMDGKTWLVTGSTDGVGRYVAAKLAAAGAKVLIHGRDKQRAKSLADEIRGQGHGEPIFYQADLSSLAGARQLAEAVTAAHKRLAVFISNAEPLVLGKIGRAH